MALSCLAWLFGLFWELDLLRLDVDCLDRDLLRFWWLRFLLLFILVFVLADGDSFHWFALHRHFPLNEALLQFAGRGRSKIALITLPQIIFLKLFREDQALNLLIPLLYLIDTPIRIVMLRQHRWLLSPLTLLGILLVADRLDGVQPRQDVILFLCGFQRSIAVVVGWGVAFVAWTFSDADLLVLYAVCIVAIGEVDVFIEPKGVEGFFHLSTWC